MQDLVRRRDKGSGLGIQQIRGACRPESSLKPETCTPPLTTMEIKKGIGVSPGVVISTAVVLEAEDLVIPRRLVQSKDVVAEVARLEAAVAQATHELSLLRDSTTAKHGKEIGGIFDFHLGVLRDKS